MNRGMKNYSVSVRFTKAEIKRLDATAKSCKMSRAEVIHARALGKILTVGELAEWAEAELAKNAQKKAHATRAA